MPRIRRVEKECVSLLHVSDHIINLQPTRVDFDTRGGIGKWTRLQRFGNEAATTGSEQPTAGIRCGSPDQRWCGRTRAATGCRFDDGNLFCSTSVTVVDRNRAVVALDTRTRGTDDLSIRRDRAGY